ncbi:MAG: hypothetical protein GXP63_01585 [DPANN group archaeon]|nr:hypothetical protein [DPANN group archaeon]
MRPEQERTDSIQVCPNCGSTEHHAEDNLSVITGKEPVHCCEHCGFRGRIFPWIAADELEGFRKHAPHRKAR